jgi:hypothetical protein
MSKRNRRPRGTIRTGDEGKTIRGDRYQVTSMGEASPVGGFAELPPKEPGRHRWIATSAYSLTPSQAAAAHAGSRVVLGPDLLMAFGVGCWDCELEYHAARIDPCLATGDEPTPVAVGDVLANAPIIIELVSPPEERDGTVEDVQARIVARARAAATVELGTPISMTTGPPDLHGNVPVRVAFERPADG